MDPRILLIAPSSNDAEMIQAALAETPERPFPIVWARSLAEGIQQLGAERVDAVMLDLFLPDCPELLTFDRIAHAAPELPVLIICAPCDEPLALQAVERGAQDYVLKTHLDNYSLRHALRNMMRREAAAEALFVERERADVTLDSIGDGVLSTDLAGRVTYLNVVAEDLTGWSREDAAGHPLSEVFHIIDGATREPAQNPMPLAIRENMTVGLTSNCLLVRRDGHEAAIEDSAAPIHDRQGRVTGAVIVFHDVSVARAMTLKMSHLAHHDALTDLPNRLLLNDRLARAIEVGRRHRRPVAVLFLDLDRFKNINDLLGHDVGDDVLRSVAERLTGRLRSSDTISRQGGDEFVIVLSDIDRPSNVIVTAKKILDAVAKPHRIRRHELRLTASIGISVYPNDGYDARGLLKDAEIAMYQAKTRGGNRYEFFQPEMNVRAVERQSLVHGLLRALDRDEFVLHYQPKIDLSTGAIIGAEALVRWRHPQLGVLRPPRFVPVAEDSGLIVPLGRWVLRRACRQARAWQDAGLRPTTVAVNVSAVELRHPGFLDGVRKTLEQTRLEPRCLELEVTETVFMSNTHSTLSVLQDLKALGLQLALDDFGTGYSSLSHLNEFPIDTLKVDESFVRDITRGDQDSPVVRAVISMGKSLNQRVIAEGVETVEQLGFLQKQGCSAGQGYYFSRPLPARQYARLLTPAGSESTH